MPQTIRFHIDENVHHAVATALRAYGINITTTTEAELIGASDSEQMVFARKENRVLFTHDRDFLRLHGAGVNHVGIVYCAKGSRSIGEIVRGLILIWKILDIEDMRNQVEFL